MDILSEFSDSLKELMLEKNLTAFSLSKATKISNATICRWVNKKQSITLSKALKLADYFECSLEFLFNRTETRLGYIPLQTPHFYNRLKTVMKLENITDYKITLKDKVFSRGQYDQWKNGSDPRIETLIKLAKYFNCTLDYLVGRDN